MNADEQESLYLIVAGNLIRLHRYVLGQRQSAIKNCWVVIFATDVAQWVSAVNAKFLVSCFFFSVDISV